MNRRLAAVQLIEFPVKHVRSGDSAHVRLEAEGLVAFDEGEERADIGGLADEDEPLDFGRGADDRAESKSYL